MSLRLLRDRETRGSRKSCCDMVDPGVLERQCGVAIILQNLREAGKDEKKIGVALNVLLNKLSSNSVKKMDVVLFGGAVLVGDIICGDVGVGPLSKRKIELLIDSLHILTELDMCSTIYDEFPFKGERMILTLFRLMTHRALFDRSLLVLEEILLMQRTTFSLASVPNISELLHGFGCIELSSFCRVLALTVFDPDENGFNMGDSKLSQSIRLIELRRDRRAVSLATLEQNHALICSMPIVVQRLVTIIRVASFAPSLEALSTESMIENISTTMHILSLLLPQIYGSSSWDSLEVTLQAAPNISHHFPSTSTSTSRRNPIHALIAPLMSNMQTSGNHEAGLTVLSVVLALRISEVFFVMTALLNGRRKINFQSMVYEAGILPELHRTFDRMSWDCILERRAVPGHGPDCTCDQESSVRIQLLRFILSLVDGSSYTLNTSIDIPREIMLKDPYEHTDIGGGGGDKLGCGMMKKLVDVLLKEPQESPYRFSMACCLETYLRSSKHHQEDQLKIAESGLLNYFLSEVLKFPISDDKMMKNEMIKPKDNDKKAPSLQVACDLIAEVCKYNPLALSILDSKMLEIVDGGGGASAYDLLKKVIFANLVDSNVLYRSMILASCVEIPCGHCLLSTLSLSKNSIDASSVGKNQEISTTLTSLPVEQSQSQNDEGFMKRVESFISETQVDMLVELVFEVKFYNISHENLCCINTALVILLINQRRNQLEQVLQAFFIKAEKKHRDQIEKGWKVEEKTTLSPRHNFRELLWFWSEYYRHRGKDRVSLYISSHIHFYEWNGLVKQLCSDDGSPTSLLSSPVTLPISPYSLPASNPLFPRGKCSHPTAHSPSP